MTNPSKYRHRVSVQKVTKERIDGQFVDTWSEYKKLWASREDKGGDEYFEAKAANAIRTVIWTIRFDKELYKNGEGRRFFYNDQSYEVKSVADVKGLRKELEIITEAVVASAS
ncbi:phage head closure protein [Virgibacillus litoralis]|uniref:SPP1 family predicted phage head-tail adaptor n=1 Tax=Virgibacillus litoralis TaxID=578221 RepID=A0ABS4HI65_9BACI|nr:phage head closure protein [Virgibacillus litoralis]MBP1950294.1 SPP1 family predicted phage head-tail adaptor [Virgibacillus litoralis]